MSTPTPTDPREEKKPKVFLVTMRARKNDGATETVSFRSGIFACESEAHAKVAMLEGREPEFSIDELDAKPFDTTFLTAPLESTNSKLAAEIAKLQIQLAAIGEFAVADWDDPTVGKIDALVKEPIKYKDRLRALFVDIPTERDTLRAELEAVKMDLETAQTSADNYWRELEAARKERDEVRESHRREIGRLIEQRDGYMDVARRESLAAVDALAAKDAAEKRLRRFGGINGNIVLNHDCISIQIGNRSMDIYEDGGVCVLISEEKDTIYECEEGYRGIRQAATVMVESINKDRAALTPAPTQEPPAGGVTISNESSGVEGHAAKVSEPSNQHGVNEASASTAGVTVSACSSEGETSPTLTSSTNSPADVPSEGRGELLPFNLSDALAGKPVVTRDGSWRGKIVAAPNLDADIIGDYVAIAVMAAGPFLVLPDGRLFNDRLNDKDLFMLPPEGSGACVECGKPAFADGLCQSCIADAQRD